MESPDRCKSSEPPGFEPMTMAEIHACLLETLTQTIQVCDRAGIEYCLIGGGCLGIVRHNGEIIPWDDDLDLAIWAVDMPRFLAAAKSMPACYRMVMTTCKVLPTVKIFNESTRITGGRCTEEDLGVFVDIIPMMAWPSETWKRLDLFLLKAHTRPETRSYRLSRQLKMQFMVKALYHQFARLCQAMDRQCRQRQMGIITADIGSSWFGKYPWTTVFPLKERELGGCKVKSPHDLHAFLTIRYGEHYMDLPDPAQRWNHFGKAFRRVG